MKNSLAGIAEAKKPLAERRAKATAELSHEIQINPPDKFSNGEAIGFTPYFTTQFGLPHSPVEGNMWQRRNGHTTLSVYSDCPYGLPSGSKPRLLLVWVATWQVRHPNQTVIELGKNVSSFLKDELGLPRTGRYIRDVRLEMIRLFSANISIVTNDEKAKLYKREATGLSDRMELWGSAKGLDQDALFPSYIELTEKFRQSILERPIPIDIRALPMLTGSSLAMDYYVWLARTMFSLKASRLVTWQALHDQFGSQYDWENKSSRFKFKSESLRQLKGRVFDAYPGLRLSYSKEGITLHPSPTPVPHVPSKKIFLPSKLQLMS